MPARSVCELGGLSQTAVKVFTTRPCQWLADTGPIKRSGSLPVAVARADGHQVAYAPGLAMRRIADLYPGRAKTDVFNGGPQQIVGLAMLGRRVDRWGRERSPATSGASLTRGQPEGCLDHETAGIKPQVSPVPILWYSRQGYERTQLAQLLPYLPFVTF